MAQDNNIVEEHLERSRCAMRKKAMKSADAPPMELPETVALVLQGGGALGSYQAGIYEALAAHQIPIDWVAGISIGAINSAIIAGNAPEQVTQKLREFWKLVSSGSGFAPWFNQRSVPDSAMEWWRQTNHNWGAFIAATVGVPGFYTPHLMAPQLADPGTANAVSIYDTSALVDTLNNLIDWERLNNGPIRLSVGAVDVESGNFKYFDTRHPTKPTRIDARHIMASGALPPGFAPIEIDGKKYWDGGLVSNTPLAYVLDNQTEDMLIFQVDLFPARGKAPQTYGDMVSREKDIRYSSRTRAVTDRYLKLRKEHETICSVLDKLPEKVQQDPDVQKLRSLINDNAASIVHLIYKVQSWESGARDFEFSRPTMEQHWAQGIDAILAAINKGDLIAKSILDGRTAAFDLDG